MKLFVKNLDGRVFYLEADARDRKEFARKYGEYFYIQGSVFTANDVQAETSSNDTIGAAAVGGLLGMLGGPPGIVLGGAAGFIIGGIRDKEERERVNFFNNSSL